jgi:hypothetical protein
MKLHPKQTKAFKATETERMVGYLGGIRSGKTITGAVFAMYMVAKFPEQIGIIAANTHKQLTKSTLKEFKGVLAESGIYEGDDYVMNKNPERFFSGVKSKFDDHNGVISFCNGAQILTVSLEQQVRGIEAGWKWVDEFQDSKLEELRVLQGRMSGSENPRILYTGTPPKHNPEIEEFIWENPDLYLVTGTTFDNAENLPDSFFELLKNYDEYTYRREVLAQRVKIPGKQWMYAFNRDKHVSERAQYSETERVYVSFDFNVSPTVALLAHRGENYIHYFAEVLLTPTEVHEETFIRALAIKVAKLTPLQWKAKNYYITGDAAGKSQNVLGKVGMNAFTEIKEILQVPDRHFNVSGSNPLHVDSRELCNSILAHHPEILIHPNCKNLILDLDNVAAKPDGGIMKDNRSDTYQRADLFDAFRYDLHAWNRDFIWKKR